LDAVNVAIETFKIFAGGFTVLSKKWKVFKPLDRFFLSFLDLISDALIFFSKIKTKTFPFLKVKKA
jgi:hypothetical protein